jgi:hypothetical protein
MFSLDDRAGNVVTTVGLFAVAATILDCPVRSAAHASEAMNCPMAGVALSWRQRHTKEYVRFFMLGENE